MSFATARRSEVSGSNLYINGGSCGFGLKEGLCSKCGSENHSVPSECAIHEWGELRGGPLKFVSSGVVLCGRLASMYISAAGSDNVPCAQRTRPDSYAQPLQGM